MVSSDTYNKRVFINCPFDIRYRRLFRAIIFTVIDCGYNPRCASDISDSSLERLNKLFKLMAECRLGIHDISRTGKDSMNRLPRFNMPFELGIFLGAKFFGPNRQKKKNCLILDIEKFRYQKFISDIGGKDIVAHENDVFKSIRAVRNWLNDNTNEWINSAKKIYEKHCDFLIQLSQQCRILNMNQRDMSFKDYRLLAVAWLAKYDEVN